MKKPQNNLFSRFSSGALRQSSVGADGELALRQSKLLCAPLLAGALIAFATLGAPVSSHAQTALKKQSELLGGDSPGDLKGETSSGDEAFHRAVDDFKLEGRDEPDFPPPSAHLSRGALHVQGTQSNDLIEIDISGASVEVTISNNANPLAPVEIYFGTFPSGDVDNLRLFGLAGKDVIVNGTSIPDFIWGGLGNDDILAGDGASQVFGQDGTDILNGNGGNDFLWGGDGGDYLFGGPGSDFVSGEDGSDWVSGGDSFGTDDDVVDMLVGGADGDIFTVPSVELADDILVDYDPTEGDVLDE